MTIDGDIQSLLNDVYRRHGYLSRDFRLLVPETMFYDIDFYRYLLVDDDGKMYYTWDRYKVLLERDNRDEDQIFLLTEDKSFSRHISGFN